MRSISCRFAAVLPILTFFSVLAHPQGTTPSQTSLFPATGTSGQIGFAVNVRPGASVQAPFTAPTGTVTLYNEATAIGSPAALTANSGFISATFTQVFGAPDASVATAAGGAAWGDFNEDGASDLLVYGTGGQPGLVVQTFLAKIPAGLPPTYTPVAAQQLALPLQLQSGQALAVLDVDGDGHLDLLAGNTVAYGKGDGTFGTVAVLPVLATGYNQTYAVDIDGDSKLDIVAVDTPPPTHTPGTVQFAFTVFHNEGGGDFTAMGPYPLTPSFSNDSSNPYLHYNIYGLSFADVNGDGRIDVLSQSNELFFGESAAPQLNIMLNLGTGFGAPKAIDTSTLPALNMVSPAFADLNGDGKQDLVFSYQAYGVDNNGVATLLGNGDGTFAAPVNFTIGTSGVTIGSPLLPLATEDVNADGKTDVVLGSGVLLLGNGDGTLTAGTPLFASVVTPLTPPPAYALLTAPPAATIPGGEDAPFFALVYINLQAGANAVFIPNIGSGATVTALLAPGTYSLTAHYSGDATYAASVSNTINVTTLPVTPTVAVTSSANPSYTGEDVTLTATITSLFAGPSGSVVFSDGTTALGTAPVTAGVATFKANFSTAGSHAISAAYSGDTNNLAANGSLIQTVDAPVTVGPGSGGSTSLTVTSGDTTTTKVSVTGAAGFGGTVSFSCTGLPMNASCSFSPASVTVSGTTAATTTLTVSTAATAMAALRDAEPSRALTVLACGLPLLGLLTLLPVARGRRLLLCFGFALFISLTSLTGCGGDSSSGTKTAPGNYTFNVVATSGSASSTASYKLTVQ